jgi:hypothetical protein
VGAIARVALPLGFRQPGFRCYLLQLRHQRGREGGVVWVAFSHDASLGWISSGFTHSPTAEFIGSTHGPLAFISQNLPTSLDDFGWMFALGGLGIALTLGIAMRIAGWGGFALNIMLWFSLFPPRATRSSTGSIWRLPSASCCWRSCMPGTGSASGAGGRHTRPPSSTSCQQAGNDAAEQAEQECPDHGCSSHGLGITSTLDRYGVRADVRRAD